MTVSVENFFEVRFQLTMLCVLNENFVKICTICFIICIIFSKAGDTSVGDSQGLGDPDLSQVIDEELDIINEDSKITHTSSTLSREASGTLLMSLDQAILKSIEACPTDEMKKKMYSSILIVGGGFKFRNADKFLMQKLALQVIQVMLNHL